MKIFNNFNTEFCAKTFSKRKEEFGDDKVFVIKRSKYFWYFTGIIPLLFLGIVFGVFLYFFYSV